MTTSERDMGKSEIHRDRNSKYTQTEKNDEKNTLNKHFPKESYDEDETEKIDIKNERMDVEDENIQSQTNLEKIFLNHNDVSSDFHKG